MGELFKMALCVTGILTMSQQVTAQNSQGANPSRLPGSAGPLRIELGTGYDFFSYSYTVLNADTTSTTSEGNLHLNLYYTPVSVEGRTVELGNRFFLGRQYNYNTLSAYWREGGWKGASASVETRWETKRYNDDGLFFSNDHDALTGTVRGAYRWRGQWSLSGRLRGELYDYERHSSFFYDTRTVRGGLTLRGGDWIGPFFEIDAEGNEQAVPDSTVLDRTDRDIRATLGWVLGSGGELEADLYYETRDYPVGGPRPDRSRGGAELRGRFAPLEPGGARYEVRFERNSYSEQTLVYNDFTELRALAGPVWRPGDEWEIRLGAGYNLRRTEAFEDSSYVDLFGVMLLTDSYSQPFLYAEANVMKESGLWAFLTLEIGRRDYDTQTEWDSDFWYVDLGATAEIPLWRGLAIQTLINLTPERHREPEDNSVTNYTSVDLLYRFR